MKRLTDDGPDTGNYYVRTVTANFNHNVPCERGRNQPTAGRAARGLGSTAGLERGPGVGQGAGGSALLPPSPGAALGPLGTCWALSPSRLLWDFGSWCEWDLCTSGQTALPGPALDSSGSLRAPLCHGCFPSCRARSLLAVPSLRPHLRGCLTEHRGCWWARCDECIDGLYRVLRVRLDWDELSRDGVGRAGQEGAVSMSTRHCQLCGVVPAPVWCGQLSAVSAGAGGSCFGWWCETRGLILSVPSHSWCIFLAENPPGAAGNHPLAESSSRVSGGCRLAAHTAGAPLGAVKKRPF